MKRNLTVFMAVVMLIGSNMTAYAADDGITVDQETDAEYQETHFQINFPNLDLTVSDQNELCITTGADVCGLEKTAAEDDISALEDIFEEFPDVEETIISDMQSVDGELVAISFTVVPLMEVDGHYERIPVSSAEAEGDAYSANSGHSSSDGTSKGNFVLYTSVYSYSLADANGNYEYTARTHGSWSNSILGGADYPASGEDYVLQATPNTFSRTSDSMSASYDNSPFTGVLGDDYWREDGDDSYVGYAIKDDPLGYRQLSSFSLKTVSDGPASSESRKINSYYIHTWSGVSYTLSIGVNSWTEVALSLALSDTEKSWQVYDYVVFDF